MGRCKKVDRAPWRKGERSTFFTALQAVKPFLLPLGARGIQWSFRDGRICARPVGIFSQVLVWHAGASRVEMPICRLSQAPSWPHRRLYLISLASRVAKKLFAGHSFSQLSRLPDHFSSIQAPGISNRVSVTSESALDLLEYSLKCSCGMQAHPG